MKLHSLITQAEVDGLSGSAKTRLRWVAAEALSAPFPVNVFGRKLRVFPDWSLAQVAVRRARRDSVATVAAVNQASAALYDRDSFKAAMEALQAELPRMPRQPDAGELLEFFMLSRHSDIFAALQEDMDEIEAGLSGARWVLQPHLALVGRVADGFADLRLLSSRLGEQATGELASALSAGSLALLEQIEIDGQLQQFVIGAGRDAEHGWQLRALADAAGSAAAARRDDGTLDERYAFLHGFPPDELDVWESHARRAILTAGRPTDWEADRDAHAAEYAATAFLTNQPYALVPSTGEIGRRSPNWEQLRASPNLLAGLTRY